MYRRVLLSNIIPGVSLLVTCISGNDPESRFIDFSVNIWILGAYEEFMLIYWPSRTQFTFLVNITSSKVYLISIVVPRDTCGNLETNVRAQSLVTRPFDSDRFFTPDATGDPRKWTNTVSEAGIEPSCAEIGQKLTSVDQKVSTTMVMTFPTLWLGILIIYYNRYMTITTMSDNL